MNNQTTQTFSFKPELIELVISQSPPPYLSPETAQILLQVWREEWKTLEEESNQLPPLPEYHSRCQSKDRFIDVKPSEHRVCLSGSNDYINADLCASDHPNQANLILTQAPLPNTKVDFAKMIVECKVDLVVSLSSIEDAEEDYLNFVERLHSLGQPKCIISSSPRGGQQSLGQSLTADIYYSTAQYTDQNHKFSIIRVGNWPDRRLPECISDLVILLECIRKHLPLEGEPTLLIHCKAGIGRTGVMSVAWRMLENLTNNTPLEPTLQCVLNMRQYRRGAVQNFEQYVGLQILRAWLVQRCALQ